jgi:hypothetical protein
MKTIQTTFESDCLLNTIESFMQRQLGMNLGMWNVISLCKPASLKALIPQLQQYKIYIAAIEETRWHGKTILDTGGCNGQGM